MMRKDNLIKPICIFALSLVLSACGNTTSLPNEAVSSIEAQDSYTYECCICHSINADGSLVFWGDRMEQDLFSAYVISAKDDIKIGDEVMLVYSERERENAVKTSGIRDVLFHLKADNVKVQKITKDNIELAVEGTRKDKYLKSFDMQVEEDKAPVEVEDIVYEEAIQTPMPALEINCIMDTTLVSPQGRTYSVKAVVAQDKTSINLAEYNIELRPGNNYLIAETAYELSETSFFGSLSDTPYVGDILFYLNESQQMSLAKIVDVEPAPDNIFKLTLEPLQITEYLN